MPARKRRVEFTRRAANEYLAELRYLASADLSAAFLVQGRIEATLVRLTRFARIGRAGRVTGTRELAVRRTLYTLVYTEYGYAASRYSASCTSAVNILKQALNSRR